jgi:hypothetical protein
VGRGAEAPALLRSIITRLEAAPGAGARAQVGALLLQYALALAADGGDMEGARAAAGRAAGSAHVLARGPVAHASRLVRAALSLEQAGRVGGGEAGAPLAGEARRLLLEAVRMRDGAVARALLARAEQLGGLRKWRERVEGHAAKAMRLAPRPVPAGLLAALGSAAGSQRLCASAVHAEPWSQEHRLQLSACAKAGA